MTWRVRPAHRYGPDEQCGAYARRAQCTPAFTLNTTTPNGELEGKGGGGEGSGGDGEDVGDGEDG